MGKLHIKCQESLKVWDYKSIWWNYDRPGADQSNGTTDQRLIEKLHFQKRSLSQLQISVVNFLTKKWSKITKDVVIKKRVLKRWIDRLILIDFICCCCGKRKWILPFLHCIHIVLIFGSVREMKRPSEITLSTVHADIGQYQNQLDRDYRFR